MISKMIFTATPFWVLAFVVRNVRGLWRMGWMLREKGEHISDILNMWGECDRMFGLKLRNVLLEEFHLSIVVAVAVGRRKTMVGVTDLAQSLLRCHNTTKIYYHLVYISDKINSNILTLPAFLPYSPKYWSFLILTRLALSNRLSIQWIPHLKEPLKASLID